MMTNYVTVYVPTTVKVNVKADTVEMMRYVAKELSKVAGGATVTEAFGYWIKEDTGELVGEKVYQVKSYYELEKQEKVINKANELAAYVKETLEQYCVTVETERGMYFI